MSELLMETPIINSKGIKSFRSADYDTYYALAEIIDNSIQANARNIHIIGIQHQTLIKERTRSVLKEVIIFDDGIGMTKEITNLCLQLGGGTHLGAKRNLGKYGMGLPQASGSQCVRTEVYTWQNPEEIYYTYLDFDELERSNRVTLPPVETLLCIPESLNDIITTTNDHHNFSKHIPHSGTIVHWKNADKLSHSTYSAFYRNFELLIGRIYRYPLQNNDLRISLTGFDNKEGKLSIIPDKNISTIRINDPLFLMEENNIIGSYESSFCDTSTNKALPETPFIDIDGKKYDVTIKYSFIKDKVLEHLENINRTSPGKTELGGLYGKNLGISLLRAGREIKLDHFGFIGDITQPIHRWWGIEVHFEPELDDLFGVTFDKQEARAFRKISEEEYKEDLMSSDDESLRLMHQISLKLSGNLKEMQKRWKERRKDSRSTFYTKCPQCGKKAIIDNKCSSCGYVLEYCGIHKEQRLIDGNCIKCTLDPINIPYTNCEKHNVPLVNGNCPICEQERLAEDFLPKEKEEALREYLIENFSEYKKNVDYLDASIQYFKKVKLNQFFIYTNLGSSKTFLEHNAFGDIIFISVNKRHPFYEKYIKGISEYEDRDHHEMLPIRLLLTSIVNAEIRNSYTDEHDNLFNDFRHELGDQLERLMRNFSLPERG